VAAGRAGPPAGGRRLQTHPPAGPAAVGRGLRWALAVRAAAKWNAERLRGPPDAAPATRGAAAGTVRQPGCAWARAAAQAGKAPTVQAGTRPPPSQSAGSEHERRVKLTGQFWPWARDEELLTLDGLTSGSPMAPHLSPRRSVATEPYRRPARHGTSSAGLAPARFGVGALAPRSFGGDCTSQLVPPVEERAEAAWGTGPGPGRGPRCGRGILRRRFR
jgi:hypothetical protein